MNHQEIVNTWKKHKERIEVSRGFSERVMTRIREHGAARQTSSVTPASRPAQMAARPWAKAAVVVVGLLIGLVRAIVTLRLILQA
jgi:hypothetical protein